MAASRLKPIQALGMLAATALFVAALAWPGCHQNGRPTALPSDSSGDPAKAVAPEMQAVTIAGETFNLELALTDDQRFQGLSDRESIPDDGGMLFVFPEAEEQAFVMRRCLVPIDLLYVSPLGEIVSMHQMEMVPYDTPERRLKRYYSGWPAQFVIELKAGSIDRLGVKVGDRVSMPLDALKDRAR